MARKGSRSSAGRRKRKLARPKRRKARRSPKAARRLKTGVRTAKTRKARTRKKRAKTTGGRLARAYRAVIDTIKDTDRLRNKLEPPATSETE